jgi:hypothetical protein
MGNAARDCSETDAIVSDDQPRDCSGRRAGAQVQTAASGGAAIAIVLPQVAIVLLGRMRHAGRKERRAALAPLIDVAP